VSAERDELRRLVEQLSDDRVPAVLAEARRQSESVPVGEWPPPWFGSFASGRSDLGSEHEDLLAEGFGRSWVIVCDTGPLVAAADRDDQHTRACTDLFTGLHLGRRAILVPAPVVAEVGDLLGRAGGAKIEAAFLRSIVQ
jgi:hypothetical protein